MERPPKDPDNLADWLWYVKYHGAHIFVRMQDSKGHWGNKSLEELDAKDWAAKVAGFLERSVLPVRVLTEEEIQENKENESRTTDDSRDTTS